MDRLGWAASSAFHVGDYHIGVRSSRPEVDGAIRRMLGAYVVDGVDAPANLSVRIGGSSVDGADPEEDDATTVKAKRRSGQAQHIHMLYRSSSLAARSRVPSRVLSALVSYLDGFLTGTSGELLQTTMLGLVAEGHAIIAPRSLLGSLKVLQPRLERLGLRFVDSPFAVVDPTRGELVVPGPKLQIDEGARQSLDTQFGPRGRADEAVRPGRYPIKGWAGFATGPEEAGPLSRAKAVAGAAGSVVIDGREPQDVLETLGEMFRTTPARALWYAGPQDAARSLGELAAG